MKTLWFKAKKYGYGWYPSTWQGWLVILGYLVIILGDAWYFRTSFEQATAAPWFVSTVLVATALLLVICYKTGEPPGWRWGNKK